MGLIHTTIFISGDVANGGASIGRSAGDPRVDRVDADHRSINHARGFLRRVITVRSSATCGITRVDHVVHGPPIAMKDMCDLKMDYNGPD